MGPCVVTGTELHSTGTGVHLHSTVTGIDAFTIIGTGIIAWTKNSKLRVIRSLMVANDVSIPRECFAKISEFRKEIVRGQRVFSLQWDLQWQKSPKT